MRVAATTVNWTVVTSFVSRVASEPAVKRSVCAKERRCTREKSALRRSLPTPVAARVETKVQSSPPSEPTSASSSIVQPASRMTSSRPALTPSSTMRFMNAGCARSIAASIPIATGASAIQCR